MGYSLVRPVNNLYKNIKLFSVLIVQIAFEITNANTRDILNFAELIVVFYNKQLVILDVNYYL